MILNENYKLNNGIEIPKLGLGTWFINNKDVSQVVVDAAKAGYRHIDTAQAYRNEAGVADGVRASGIKREEFFITSKLAAEAKDYKKAVKSIDGSLQKMKLDYLDMMIIHSPQPWTKFRGQDRYFEGNAMAWRALEEAYTAGKVRAIGLSNFEKEDIDNILKHAKVKPMVNQVLAHIGNTPFDLIDYSQEKGMLVEGYSPVAHGVLLNNKPVQEMAKKYGVTVAQLCVRYDLQLGLLPLPKTSKFNHMVNNGDVDFNITEEDMKILKAIEPITDYGDASMMPVYGGQLNLKSMVKMVVSSFKN